jgi:probable selenium-dependent hydroxylase accessory protein YqeC
MYLMAKLCADNGMKVLVSTTTHIMKPKDGSYAKTMEKSRQIWENGGYVTVGSEAENGKISMLPKHELCGYIKEADIVFLEADGSKRLPVKVPNENEPVILDESDIVIAVCGMSCLGKPFKEVCFRLNEAQNLLGKSPDEKIEKSDIVKILTSENGSRKNVGTREYYIVLNQCDNEEILRQAKIIAADVKSKGFENITTMSITRVNKR